MARAPSRILLLATVIAVAFSLWETRGQAYFSDEWGRWITYPGLSFEDTLHGASGHLIVIQVWLYRAVVEVFGAASYLPFRLLAAAFLAGCAWLFYLWARDGVDPWLAVAAAAVLLFLGAAWEVVATPYGIVILLPVACGLAALNCLEREGVRWRLGACALLITGVASGSFALPFLAGAAVALALDGRRRLVRDAWVVAVPPALYAAWFAWTRTVDKGPSDADPLSTGSVADVPRFGIELIASGLAAATGLFRDSTEFVQFETEAGFVLVGLLACAAILLALRIGIGPVARRSLVPLVMLLCCAVLVGLVANELRRPTSARYIYPAALFSLMLVVSLAPRRPLRRGELVGLGAATAVGITANVISYHQAAGEIRAIGEQNRIALAALAEFEPPGGYSRPASSLDGAVGPGPEGITNQMRFTAPQYMEAAGGFGDPAGEGEALVDASTAQMSAADRLLARASGLELVPAARRGGELCQRVKGSPDVVGTISLEAPPGATLTVSAFGEGPGVILLARGIGSQFTPIGAVAGGFSGRLDVPSPDRVGWELRLSHAQPAEVCVSAQAEGAAARRG